MAEKRRGLGRGLGALIPSAPAEEEAPSPAAAPARAEEQVENRTPDEARKQGGRPADLFFERVTEDDLAVQPRSYSSALRSGINRNVLEAQTKRVSKSRGKNPVSPAAESPEDPEARAEPPSVLEESVEQEAAAAVQTALTGTEEPAVPSAGGGTDDAVSRETPKQSDQISPSDESALVEGSNGLVQVPGATFADLPLNSIHPNRKQPRVEFNEDELHELVHSIREIGVLQPIVVRPSQEAGAADYELVMGERRWRASREAGLETVPAIIRSTLDDDLLRDALLENLHRSALNPLEEAAAYQQLLDDFGCSHDELAGRLGRSRPQISNTLRLMKLPPLVQRRVAAGVLSAGHARALLGLEDPAEMEKIAQRIVAEGLSVRSTEEIVALSGGLRRATKPGSPRDGARHERLDYLATSLSDRLDTNVKITLGAKKGRVSIEFGSVDDLNRIIGVLSPTGD